MSADTEAVSPLEIKWEEFRRTDDFKEVLRFAGDREAFKELVYYALAEGYDLGKQEGVDEAAKSKEE